MPTLLIVFASTEGQTEKIADHIRARLEGAGHRVVETQAGQGEAPAGVEAVIVAGSLHLGRHQPELVDFVKRHRETLQAVPGLFLSVSLSAQGDAHDRADAQRCVDDFLTETGWQPTQTALVAGGVHLKKINIFKRFALRRILRQKGYEVEPSGDLEFTDWAGLDRTVDSFVKRL